MANLTISYAEMEQTASQLGQAREELTDKLRALRAMISEHVKSGFVTDRASDKFDGAFAEFTESATVVVGALTDMQGYLTSSADALRDLDAQMAARIG